MDVSQLLRALGLDRAYQAYQQNIGEPFAAMVGGAGRGYLGLDKPEYGGLLAEESYRTGQALGSMPGIGAPAGAFSVGAKAVAQVPGLLADAMQMMKANPEAGLLALTGYHGSPYRFSKFDASKIGSGEGAQMYGHGIYFAESPDIANYYKTTTAVDKYETSAGPLRSSDLVDALVANAGNVQPQLQSAYMAKANEIVRDLIMGENPESIAKTIRESKYARTYSGLADSVEKLNPVKASGVVYTVDIPDEMIGKMIDWDKPIGRQSKQVKEAIQQTRSMLPQNAIDDLGGDLSLLYGPNVTVNQFLNTWESLTGKTGSGEAALRQFGVPGVKYFDEQSRQKGKGTRNFVVFPGEEEAVRILNIE